MESFGRGRTGQWLVDLDGVVWTGERPIPGAAGALRRLGEAGTQLAYFTNNSHPRRGDHLAKLARHGLDVDPGDLLTSAEAAARLCRPGERALVLGGPGIQEALEARGVEPVQPASQGARSVDAVVVGLDLGLDYWRLSAGMRAVLAGARLVATNDDATFPVRDGLQPGAGSVLAALEVATGARAVVAGKPNEPAASLVAERLGRVDLVVGDRTSTDGALARRLGARFALVLSGVTRPGAEVTGPEPDLVATDVADLVRHALSGEPLEPGGLGGGAPTR